MEERIEHNNINDLVNTSQISSPQSAKSFWSESSSWILNFVGSGVPGGGSSAGSASGGDGDETSPQQCQSPPPLPNLSGLAPTTIGNNNNNNKPPDTIYLCNFRVSVDGDWLCLRQLDDVEVPILPSPDILYDFRDPTVVERNNLLNITKLVIKELIDWSLRHGRSLEPEHPPLQHFFIVLEHAMRHGLKPKKGLLGPKKELWDVLQLIEKHTQGAEDITNSIKDLPTVSTHTGRARAFMRLALMQKKLADYFKVLVDLKHEILSEFYEPFALMMSDEGSILGGVLVGLNVIDCNFCLKEEDLDSQQGVIDFSLYLRSSVSSECVETDASTMDNVLDQKNYIEELNRHLNATVTNLQSRVETLTTTNALLSEDLSISKKVIASMGEVDAGKCSQLEKENETLKSQLDEKESSVEELRKQLEEIKGLNLEMYRKLQECESGLKFKNELVTKLEEKVNVSDDTLARVQDKLSSALGELRSVCLKLAEKELQLATSDGDLRIATTLNNEIKQSNQNYESRINRIESEYKTQSTKVADLTLTINMMTEEMAALRSINTEQERTLEEMGEKVQESKLLYQDLKESGIYNKWKDDAQTSHCTGCQQKFSITKRRHHCRSCGEIFCSTCSDNEIELASFPKPVRVCDPCYVNKLQRCSVNNT